MTLPIAPARIPRSYGVVREWLRTLTLVEDSRIFFDHPRSDAPKTKADTFKPFLVMYKIGGRPDDDVGDIARFMFEVWARTKDEADNIANDLAYELQKSNYQPEVVTSFGKFVAGSIENGPQDVDPQPTWAHRYDILAELTLKPLSS